MRTRGHDPLESVSPCPICLWVVSLTEMVAREIGARVEFTTWKTTLTWVGVVDVVEVLVVVALVEAVLCVVEVAEVDAELALVLVVEEVPVDPYAKVVTACRVEPVELPHTALTK